MSHLKAKMYQNRFRLQLCPRARWGAYIAPLGSLDEFKGPTSKGKGGFQGRGGARVGKGKKGGSERKEGKREGGKGKGEGKKGREK